MKIRKYKFVVKCLGTVHFLPGRGSWWDLGGSPPKKTALKGGSSKKNKGKGGVT